MKERTVQQKMRGESLPARILSPGVALFLFLLGWYVLTMSGHTYTSDEETMLAAGESLLANGSFVVERDFLMDVVPGADDKTYSKFAPGQSLAVLPFLALGQVVAGAAPEYASGLIVRLFVLLLPALGTAATALVLYAWVRLVGYSTQIGLTVGLLYGVTSLAWPYSRTFFAEPLTTLFLLVCAYALRREEHWWWLVGGAAAACALVVKVQAGLALPCIALYALLVGWHGADSTTDNRIRARVVRLGGRVVMGLVGFAVPSGLLLLYNTSIFGGPLNTGYSGSSVGWLFDGWWQEGLYGLTLSPGKGLLIFSPTVLLGLLGLAFRLRQQWRESLLAVILLVAHLAFYSNISYWHGDGSWGPRYMVFVVPFLYLPAAGVLAALAAVQSVWAVRGRVLVMLLALASLLVQTLPVLVNLNTYIQLSDAYARYFHPATSPIAGHARLWQERVGEWWLRIAPPDGVVVLRSGFSYSEGDRTSGELLPRWTHDRARMLVYPAADRPVAGRLVVADHRPWTPQHPLPRANFALLLNGQPLENVQRTDLTGESILWELRFHLAPEQVRPSAELTLQSDTWNPTQVTEDNPRNEELGLFVQQIDLHQDGQPLTLREALPIPQPTANRRGLWLWYYDTPNHHLFDTWWWYLLVAHLPLPLVALLLALVGLPSLLALGAGGWGMVRVLRQT